MLNYTTIDQSKHLMELGLDPKTADFAYDGKVLEPWEWSEIRLWKGCENALPCWSVGALIQVLPEVGNNVPYVDRMKCQYMNKVTHEDAFHGEVRYDTMQSVYHMVCWLIENRYILPKPKAKPFEIHCHVHREPGRKYVEDTHTMAELMMMNTDDYVSLFDDKGRAWIWSETFLNCIAREIQKGKFDEKAFKVFLSVNGVEEEHSFSKDGYVNDWRYGFFTGSHETE